MSLMLNCSEASVDPWERIKNTRRENLPYALFEATSLFGDDHVAHLLTMGASILKLGMNQETALHIAAKNGMVKKLELLAGSAAEVAIPDGLGHTPAEYAAMYGHERCLQILQNHHSLQSHRLEEEKPRSIQTLGPFDKIHRSVDLTDRILHASPKDYPELLNESVRYGKKVHLLILLNKGALITPVGNSKTTVLHTAAKCSKEIKLAILLQVATDVSMIDAAGRRPIDNAAEQGSIGCFNLLLSRDPEVLAVKSTLTKAMQDKSYGDVSYLLDKLLHKHRELYSRAAGSGGTPPEQAAACDYAIDKLLEAVKLGDTELLKIFLDKGFSVNGGVVYKRSCRTKLMVFLRCANTVERRRSTNQPEFGIARCKDGQEGYSEKILQEGYEDCPLLIAVEQGNLPLLTWLKENGAKLDIPIPYCQVVKRIPQHQACFHPIDMQGKVITPLEWARLLKKDAIAEYISNNAS